MNHVEPISREAAAENMVKTLNARLYERRSLGNSFHATGGYGAYAVFTFFVVYPSWIEKTALGSPPAIAMQNFWQMKRLSHIFGIATLSRCSIAD